MFPWLSYLAMSKNATLPFCAIPFMSGRLWELPTTVLVTCVPCPMVPPSLSVFSYDSVLWVRVVWVMVHTHIYIHTHTYI